jgi:hypothetical protein
MLKLKTFNGTRVVEKGNLGAPKSHVSVGFEGSIGMAW